MNRRLLSALGLLSALSFGCQDKESEPVDIDRMVKVSEEEQKEWSPIVEEKLITGEPYPQETLPPEGTEIQPLN